jgi:glutamine amidotransferase
MIAIIDYGAGNIFSVKNALDYLGLESRLVSDIDSVKSADAVILPGVGAFPAAMKKLEATGLVDTIKEEAAKKPFLGICLGMQLIFEKGYEFEETDGLGLIGGSVIKNRPDIKVAGIGHLG